MGFGDTPSIFGSMADTVFSSDSPDELLYRLNTVLSKGEGREKFSDFQDVNVEQFQVSVQGKESPYEALLALGFTDQQAAQMIVADAAEGQRVVEAERNKNSAVANAKNHAAKILLELQPELIYGEDRRAAVEDVALLDNLAEGFGVSTSDIMNSVKEIGAAAEADRVAQVVAATGAPGEISYGEEGAPASKSYPVSSYPAASDIDVLSRIIETGNGGDSETGNGEDSESKDVVIKEQAKQAGMAVVGSRLNAASLLDDAQTGNYYGANLKQAYDDMTDEFGLGPRYFYDWVKNHMQNNQALMSGFMEESGGDARRADNRLTSELYSRFNGWGFNMEEAMSEGGWLSDYGMVVDTQLQTGNNRQGYWNSLKGDLSGLTDILPIMSMGLADQFRITAMNALPGMVGRPDMMRNVANAFSPTLGRYILQGLIGEGKGDWDPSKGVGELFYQFAERGFNEGADTFNWGADKLRGAWDVLVDSSFNTPMTEEYNPENDPQKWFHKAVAQMPEYQEAAARVIGGVTGVGIFADLRRKAFDRIYNRYTRSQATAVGEDRMGLAAWLSNLPNSPWARSGQVQDTEQI